MHRRIRGRWWWSKPRCSCGAKRYADCPDAALIDRRGLTEWLRERAEDAGLTW